jgi:undecaprenyl pyrophosphate phosphatase UppP
MASEQKVIPSSPVPSGTESQYRIVLDCLNRVRRRLWLTRFGEHAALFLAVGAGVAIALSGARWVSERFLWLAIVVALLPAVVSAGILFNRRKLIRRQRDTQVLAGLAACCSVGFVVWLCVASTSQVPAWAVPVAVMGVFLAAAVATLRPISSKAAAIFVDQSAGLQERVATAFEFATSAGPVSAMESAFRQPVLAAAVEACHTVRRAKVRYARADGRLYPIAAATVIAAAAVSALAPLPAAAHATRQPYVAVIEKSKKLENLLNDLEQKKIPENAVAEKKVQPLKDALAELRKGNMSPFEADARLTQEKGDLQKEQEQMDAAERVEKALDNIKDLDDVAKAGDQLKQANVKNANGDAAGQAAGQQANQAVKDAADAAGNKMNNGGMSGADKDKLAEDLQKAADQAKGDPQLQKSLQDAADAAKKGDGKEMGKSLAAAAERMGEKGAEQQLSGDAVRQAMEAIDQSNREGGGEQQSAQGGDNPSSEQNGPSTQEAKSGLDNGGQSGQQQQGGGQSGQNGGQQQAGGQGGQSGGQQGGGQQSAQAAGGQSGGDPQSNGGGSTNLHAPSGPGDHNAGHPVGGTSDYVKVYDEKAIISQGQMEHVSGKINPLGVASGSQQILGQGDKGDPTIQTYESQLPAARKRALDDLQTQQIPPQYRDLIRNYYAQ